jgi:hypothetical protein
MRLHYYCCYCFQCGYTITVAIASNVVTLLLLLLLPMWLHYYCCYCFQCGYTITAAIASNVVTLLLLLLCPMCLSYYCRLPAAKWIPNCLPTACMFSQRRGSVTTRSQVIRFARRAHTLRSHAPLTRSAHTPRSHAPLTRLTNTLHSNTVGTHRCLISFQIISKYFQNILKINSR